MIVVEGADNVGKSTLIQQLLEADSRLHVLKRERFQPKRGETIGQSYLNMLVGHEGEPSVTFGVADRLLASECVYGKLFRGGCRMSDREHYLIKAMLLSHGAIVVHCDVSDDEVRRTWHEREQLYDKDPLVIVRAYRRNIARIFHPIPVVRYDWTSPLAEIERTNILISHGETLAGYHQPVGARVFPSCRHVA
jgi:hypothetical protein